MKKIWLTNVYDINKTDAFSLLILRTGEGSREEQWEKYKKWVLSKDKGRPQSTKECSVEDLEAMGYIGLYDCPKRP